MSKTITIPTNRNPYIVVINNHVYRYRAGETVEVPDEVAEAIEDSLDLEPKPKLKKSRIASLLDKSITELTAEDLVGLQSIGERVFAGFNSLTSITIPDSVTEIGSEAFDGCVSLTSVTMGEGIKKIGMSAFAHCAIEELTFPASVTYIDEGATYMTPIKTITMLGRVPPTLACAFDYNEGIEKIIVPKGCGEVYKSHTNWAKFGDIIEEAKA